MARSGARTPAPAVGILAACLALTWASRSAVAQEPTPLVVFYAPGEAKAGVRDARDAVGRAASARGTAVVDLSPPPEPPPSAPAGLRRAVESYHGFSYAQALAEIDAALDEASRTGARGLRPVDLSDLFIYRALVLTAQGDTASAWDDFTHAAAIDATRTLDPARFSPGVVASFQRAAAGAAAGERTELTVDAAGACALSIDGRPHKPGEALSVPRGQHFVRVQCPGARSYGARVLADRPQQTLAPRLEPVRPPGDQRVLEEARTRAAPLVLYAVVSGGKSGAPTLTTRLLEVATGKERTRTVVAATSGGGRRIQSAVERMIDDVVSPRLPLVDSGGSAPARAWYESPWLWGAVGAAATAAILLPFVLSSDGDGGGFDVVPEGVP